MFELLLGNDGGVRLTQNDWDDRANRIGHDVDPGLSQLAPHEFAVVMQPLSAFRFVLNDLDSACRRTEAGRTFTETRQDGEASGRTC